MRVAVIGGGLLGSLVALFAAGRGWDVELVDARPAALSAASRANEGKIHLGPVFALGDEATQEIMLRGALSFASLVEDAVGERIDWAELSTDPFDYIVMPSSLLDATALARRYFTMNARLEKLAGSLGVKYLGSEIDHVIDPEPSKDPTTGLPVFATEERAVDPILLCARILSHLSSRPNIIVRVSRRVLSLELSPSGVMVSWQDVGNEPDSGHYDFAVNCAWESQLALQPGPDQGERNFRVKTAVRIPSVPGGRTVTLVQGPFGDVVSHRGYTYASWYPDGRLTNEFGSSPSKHASQLLGQVNSSEGEEAHVAQWRLSLINRQLEKLQNLRVLPPGVVQGELVGGVIVGHGPSDIHRLGSRLHSRAEFGADVSGHLITPRNFKLTTAPLAAMRAVEAIDTVIAPTVVL